MIKNHKKIIILNKKKIKINKIINSDILLINDYIILPGMILPINIIDKILINYIYYNVYILKKKLTFFNKINIYNINIKNNIYNLGIITNILKIYKMYNNSITLILQGICKCKLKYPIIKNKYSNNLYKGKVITLIDKKFKINSKNHLSYLYVLKKSTIKFINYYNNNKTLIYLIDSIKNIGLLIYLILLNFKISLHYKYLILKELDYKKQSKILLKYLYIEIKKYRISKNIKNKIKKEINKQQINYYLNLQIKAIQDKLGIKKDINDINYLIKKFFKKKINIKEVKKKFFYELEKLRNTNPNMPEYTIIKNYLDFLLNLPWSIYSKDNFNFKKAINILNKNHYGLKNIKNRILEYLSVLKLNKYKKSPILCFIGPPGVGKTSLGKSISKMLCRKYIRISLGGVYDESEIRGHRKTYVGAMPGRILQSINKIGISNPVFLLDEIDKLGIRGYNGDPSSALLEVLDPEQNKSFYDNYLELGYDLSKILFIATANNVNNINYALLDRMEVIYINGYTLEEKINIVKKFILPKLIYNNGLKKYKLTIKKKYIKYIILNYTCESGIRNLERTLDKIIRYIVKKKVINKKEINSINYKKLYNILGPNNNINKYDKIKKPGVSIGLAWTGTGGDIIYIESCLLKKGKGNISITGNIGKIMKESIIIAIKYIRSNYKEFNIQLKYFYNYDLHIHVPEGAIPKDGPSAGIAIFTSLISTFINKKIINYLAMTGEITLRGNILPVGGIKEKILAAKRYKIKKIILSYNNKQNIYFLNKKYIKGLKFYFLKNINELINIIFK